MLVTQERVSTKKDHLNNFEKSEPRKDRLMFLRGFSLMSDQPVAENRLVQVTFNNPQPTSKTDTVQMTYDGIGRRVAITELHGTTENFILNLSLTLGNSMADTLKLGDITATKKYYYGYSFFGKSERFFEFHKPKRGDIIGFFPYGNRNFLIGKRCVAIPGDVLELKDRVLYINGQIQNENYVKYTDSKILSAKESHRDNYGPVTIDNNCCFVMGDNRDNSWDSRYADQLDERSIVGKIEPFMPADKFSLEMSVKRMKSGE
jgi:signal peptidase I